MLLVTWKYVFVYLIVVFVLGALRHLVFFKNLYARFGNFDQLHKPRFEFGIASMFVQGIAFGFLYTYVTQWLMSPYQFIGTVFLILLSFIAFAELGKHTVHHVWMFLFVQTLYCLIQTGLVYWVFYLVS